MKTLPFISSFLAFAFPGISSSATEIYDLDFTSPEVGIYQTVFGHPLVQASVGPFSNALVFQAVTGYEQIQLPIVSSARLFDLECDILVHNLLGSNYGFSILLDAPMTHSVTFHGGLNRFDIFQSFGTVSGNAGSFVNDRIYHFKIFADLAADHWSVSIDGVEKYSSALNGSSLSSIRFNMSPAFAGTGNSPGTYAALDNVRVSTVPEPTICSFLAAAAGWVMLGRRCPAEG